MLRECIRKQCFCKTNFYISCKRLKKAITLFRRTNYLFEKKKILRMNLFYLHKKRFCLEFTD